MMAVYRPLPVQKPQTHLEGRPLFNPRELPCPKRRLRQFWYVKFLARLFISSFTILTFACKPNKFLVLEKGWIPI